MCRRVVSTEVHFLSELMVPLLSENLHRRQPLTFWSLCYIFNTFYSEKSYILFAIFLSKYNHSLSPCVFLWKFGPLEGLQVHCIFFFLTCPHFSLASHPIYTFAVYIMWVFQLSHLKADFWFVSFVFFCCSEQLKTTLPQSGATVILG